VSRVVSNDSRKNRWNKYPEVAVIANVAINNVTSLLSAVAIFPERGFAAWGWYQRWEGDISISRFLCSSTLDKNPSQPHAEEDTVAWDQCSENDGRVGISTVLSTLAHSCHSSPALSLLTAQACLCPVCNRASAPELRHKQLPSTCPAAANPARHKGSWVSRSLLACHFFSGDDCILVLSMLRPTDRSATLTTSHLPFSVSAM
jgi:hypothetical protein